MHVALSLSLSLSKDAPSVSSEQLVAATGDEVSVFLDGDTFDEKKKVLKNCWQKRERQDCLEKKLRRMRNWNCNIEQRRRSNKLEIR